MKALRTHQLRWNVIVTRKYNPPRTIVVFGRTPAEAIRGAVSSAREVWGIWDAKSFSPPEKKNFFDSSLANTVKLSVKVW
jgi:hypothetical protein